MSAAQFSGETAFQESKLRPMIHLKPGEPANAAQLQDDLLAVKKLYGTKGYLAAEIQPTPQFDDAQSMVSYQIEVREGDVYKMGELTIEGLDKETTARLDEDWKLRGGDAYDSSYPHRFLTEKQRRTQGHGRLEHDHRRGGRHQRQIVDVTIRYDPKPR